MYFGRIRSARQYGTNFIVFNIILYSTFKNECKIRIIQEQNKRFVDVVDSSILLSKKTILSTQIDLKLAVH